MLTAAAIWRPTALQWPFHSCVQLCLQLHSSCESSTAALTLREQAGLHYGNWLGLAEALGRVGLREFVTAHEVPKACVR